MGTLGSRDHRRKDGWGERSNWLHLDVQALAVQVDTRLPLVPPVPVSPEERGRSQHQGMEQEAHLAWFARGAPAPLAVLT